MCKKVLSIILTLALCCGIGLSAEAVAVSNLSATDSFESGNTAQPYYNYTSDRLTKVIRSTISLSLTKQKRLYPQLKII